MHMALAVLLSFVLAPLVGVLERRRPSSAWVLRSRTLAATAALGTMAMAQVINWQYILPRSTTILSKKVHHVRDVVGTSDPLKNASGLLTHLGRELEESQIEKGRASVGSCSVVNPVKSLMRERQSAARGSAV